MPKHSFRLFFTGDYGPSKLAYPFFPDSPVAEFDTLETAQAWADTDPYVAAGVYEKVIVKPFKKVLP